MDNELPPWNKHGNHNSRVPNNITEEHQEVGYSNYICVHYDKVMTEGKLVERGDKFSHRTWLQPQPKERDLVGDSFTAGEPLSSLSSCMSGAFKALLPDYHGTSSEMTTSSVEYSCSPNNNCLIKPGTEVDEKTVVERREKRDFLKEPLCEASANVTPMDPPRSAQYVPQEKEHCEVDQGNSNWTSVIKDALEMSNGMEMEKTLSMDVCGPLMDFKPVYKGPETEAKFALKDHYQIAGSKLNEEEDGQGVKGEPDSFISALSDGISKKKDILEMGENDESSILDVGTSLVKEELGMTGIRENEPGILPGFNSSYTPFSSSEGFMKHEEFIGIPLVKQSVEHTLHETTQGPKMCKDVSPRKTGGTNICFKHATVKNKTVLESSSVFGPHHIGLQKDYHQAEVTDGNTSVDQSSQHDVQDKRVNASNLHASETTLIEQSSACVSDTQYFGCKLKKQDHDLLPSLGSVSSQNTAVVECENSKEDRTSESSLSVPVFQKISGNTKKVELGLKLETESGPEIQNFSTGSGTVPDQIHLDYKCKDSQIEPRESGKINPSTVLLSCDETVHNSEKNEKKFLNITSESSIPPHTETIHAASCSPTSGIDGSSQPNLQKALQKHKKARKRKKSELEELYGSEIPNSPVKPETIGGEDTNQNFSLTNHDSTALKEEYLITNGDVNPTSSRRKSLLRMTQLELAADTAETSKKLDHSCSETSHIKALSTTMIDRKAVTRWKLRNKTRLCLKAKKSARVRNQCLSQGAVLSSEDCTSPFFQVSRPTLVKEVSNPALVQQAISRLECSPERSTKKNTLQTKQYTLQTLQSKGDLLDDPTTFSEVEADLMDSKRHQKVRRPGIKASEGKHDELANSLLNSQSLLESMSQTDSVSTSVTESSNILSPQKTPKKSRQKKRADVNKGTKSPQEDVLLPLSKSKGKNVISNTRTVKIYVKKATRKDDCDTTVLDIQPSVTTLKQTDSVPTVGAEVEPPVGLSLQRKSQKKNLPTVDQTTAQQSVLNPLSECDAIIVQPVVRRFSPRKTLDKKRSLEVNENCETVHLNQSVSSVDSVSTTVTDISGVSQKITKKSTSKRKTNMKSIEAQTSKNTAMPSEDFVSIVVSNPEKTVKVKRLPKNKTNDNSLNNLVEDTSLPFVTQDISFSPSKIDCSSSFRQSSTPKKTRKKTVTKIKNKAEEILHVNQHEDKVASSSEKTLKEKRDAVTEEMNESHPTGLFVMQTSTKNLQHTECVSASFAHSTLKESKKMSDIKGEAVHTPEVDQSKQQELHPCNSASATEMDNSDVLNQKKMNAKTKRKSKKVTKCKTHVTQAMNSITKKHMKTKTSTLKVINIQPEDNTEHPTVLSTLLHPPKSLVKDATQDPCMKTDFVNESAESHVENQVFITAEAVACSQNSLKKARKTKGRRQLLVQSNILELAHREDKKSDIPPENFEVLEAESCGQQKKKKAKISQQIAETHEFADVSLSQEKITGSDEAGVMVTFTQIQDFCKKSQQPEKDENKEESKIKDLKGTKNPKTKSRKAGRKKRRMAGLLTQTVKEDEHKDISYDNRFACDFQNNTQIPISDCSQRTTVIPEDQVMKSRKSACPQKTNLGPFVENVSSQASLDITECCHTRLGKSHSGSMQPADCEDQYTFEQKLQRQGRKTLIKSKKEKLCKAYLEDNISPSVQIADFSLCQVSTETRSSSMQPADCVDQCAVQKKSPRRGRPPSMKNKKQKLSIAHLEDDTSPSIQISDFSSCQDSTETLSGSMQPADCEDQCAVKQKSPRRGRAPSFKNKKQKLCIAHLEDDTSPSVQISDISCQDSIETLSSSMQPSECEGQYAVKLKSPRRGRPPSIKEKKQKLSIAHLEDDTSPSVQMSDLLCQDITDTLSSSIQPADCEGQCTVKQNSQRRGRPPSINSKKKKLSIAHLEDNSSPSVQMSDLSCQDSIETLSSSIQPAECEDQHAVKQKSPRQGKPPSIKDKKQKLSIEHLEDNASPTVQCSDLSCQDSTEKTVKAAASPVKQTVVQTLKKRKAVKVDNVTVTKQLGPDPSESLQSVTDYLSHNIPAPKHKKITLSTSEPSVKGFQKADIHSLPQNSTNYFNKEGKTYLPMPGTVKKLCEKTAKLNEDVLADIKVENKATVQVVKAGKRGKKRRKIKEPPPDLGTEHGELQRLTTQTKDNKRQDCSEQANSLLTEFGITNECSTEYQNNIVISEKNDHEKSKLSGAEIIPGITIGTCQITPKTEVLCSSSTHMSSKLMNKVKKYKEHNAEPNGEDLFAIVDKTGISGGVSSRIGNLISSNESSRHIFLDTKMKPNVELKCTEETDGQRMEMSGEIMLDNLSEIENAFSEQKVDGFTQASEECVACIMPNKTFYKRTMRSKPKEIMKKPLTCKYCGVSFRHITAYAIHQRIHTGDKPYKCKICGKTFAQVSKLKSHRDVHKQDASFPCPCCSQRFLQKENLLCHFKVHLQESNTNSEPHIGIKSKKNTSSDVWSRTPNNYVCLICKKNFVNHVKLQNHMQSHEVEKPLTCKDCGKRFWKQSSLAAHEKSHWPVKPYACSICGKGFNQLKALKKHSQDHAGETPFSCFHCGLAFSDLSALRMHQASKTCIASRNDVDSSNIEGFIVSQGVDGQVNTPVFFKCQICKQLFRKWCQYTLHLQTHTSSPPYICFSCGQCYEKDSEMNVHCEVCCQSSGEEQICGASLSEVMQGVTQTYPLKCTSSQTLPRTGFQLNSQMPTSSEQLPQRPQLMDVEPTQRATDLSQPPKTFSTQSPIKLPMVQSPTHSDVNCTSASSSLECIEITPSLWKFKCSHCGQRFEQYRTLSAHLQMHASGFRYTCAHCGQFFERWSKLWLHQRRHRLKSRCYSCNQCNLQFRFFSSFKEHMIDHAGQRPYACTLCPETFLQEASLHAHQCESHKLCKSLKCDVCSKTFSSLTNLIKHSLLHNGSTSHICRPCNLSFTNTRVLKEHLKTHIAQHGPVLPDIPSKPLDFPHKCKRCKASFSTADLLYAHQIRHSREAKTHVHPAIVPTSKSSTQRNHLSNLNLDGIPNDESIYVYSHPDRLYVPPSRRVQIPVINLDRDEHEDSQNTSPVLPNCEINALSDSAHLPQPTAGQETTILNISESVKEKANGEHNYRHKFQRTSVDMEVETTAQEEESEESFECADCMEKLSSVLNLYEHYILHAIGDAYVQVH